jgi:hypothetical protein
MPLTISCHELSAQRAQCHNLYGKAGEECLVYELEEKRCLSFLHCNKQAKAYYGTLNGPDKAICGSWAEAFCFGDDNDTTVPLLARVVHQHNDPTSTDYNNDTTAMMIRQESHQRARDIVNTNKALKAECRTLAFELSKCLQKKL